MATLGVVERQGSRGFRSSRSALSSQAASSAVVVAVARGGIYFLVFADVLLRHFVPPHPWKAGLAYVATIGIVLLVEGLWIRTGPAEHRARSGAVGAAAVTLAFALAFFAAAVGLFGPN